MQAQENFSFPLTRWVSARNQKGCMRCFSPMRLEAGNDFPKSERR